MAKYKLISADASVEIDEHASEIHHFQDNNGNEYMWQGAPAFWKGRNPTLFPMVGSTWDKKLHINGKEYETGNHGFTRNSDFTCIEHDDSHVVMELKDSEDTLNQYPFHFTLQITYRLDGKTLTVSYEIVNENDCVMPFNFGLHPAFRCPVRDGSYEDYYLKFDQKESFTWLDTTMDNEDVLSLDKEALSKTIIIHQPNSKNVQLTNGEHGVNVGFDGYEWLAFWSPNAPFVCIEPWYSHTDFEKVEVPFEQREGTQFLQPHESFHADYTITIF